MIDKNTGAINFENFVVTPNDKQSSVLKFTHDQITETRDMGGWTWLVVKNILINNKFFIFSFAFFNDHLREIHLQFQDMVYDFSKGWASWSEFNELKTWKDSKNGCMSSLVINKSLTGEAYLPLMIPEGGFSSIVVRYK